MDKYTVYVDINGNPLTRAYLLRDEGLNVHEEAPKGDFAKVGAKDYLMRIFNLEEEDFEDFIEE